MRVAVVSHTYVTRMSQEKIQAMAEHGFEVLLMVPEKVKDTLREIHFQPLDHARYRWITLRSIGGFHNSLRAYETGKLRHALREFRPDVVLVEQEPYSFSTWQISRLKKTLGFKLVVFTFQNIHKVYPWPFAWIERRNLEASDHLIAGCQSVAPVWTRKGMEERRVSVLPQVGVNPDVFRPIPKSRARARLGLEDGFMIGYAGRFVEEKGLAPLIDALQATPRARLVLLGRGPYRPELERRIAERGLKDRVRFLDSLTHEEMPAIFPAFDVLVLPSLRRPHWREQFGHVLIEAMACEVPCIGTDIDPINAIIADTGWTFAEGNARDLARAFETAMSDQAELARRGRLARERVEKHYTNRAIAAGLEKVFRSLSPEVPDAK